MWEATAQRQLGLAGRGGFCLMTGNWAQRNGRGGRAIGQRCPKDPHRPPGDPEGDVSAVVLHRLPQASVLSPKAGAVEAAC